MRFRSPIGCVGSRITTACTAALGMAIFATSVITAQSGPKAYTAARTPWGDPDLQGIYTNSDESGIPMARPAEFAGKRPEEVTSDEMVRLMKQRAQRIEQTAAIIGATTENDTGAGPTHWYENYNPKNSRPWMISDPPDYQVPATTQESRDRAAKVRAGRRGGDGYNRGPFDGPEDFTLYVRCITRGVPGSMTPAIYGNSYDITQGPGFVAIRYEMVHEARIIPLAGGARAGRDPPPRRPRAPARRHPLVHGRRPRPFRGRYARCRNHKLPGAIGDERGVRAPEDDRAFQTDRTEDDRLVDHARRSAHLDAAVDLRDAADEGSA